MKLKLIVVYENSSDEFDIEHPLIKVTVGLQKFPHLPKYKLSGPVTQLWYKNVYSSYTNIQIHEYRHA